MAKAVPIVQGIFRANAELGKRKLDGTVEAYGGKRESRGLERQFPGGFARIERIVPYSMVTTWSATWKYRSS